MTGKCEHHEEVVSGIARIDEKVSSLLKSFDTLDKRLYEQHGKSSGTASAIVSIMKTVGMVTAIGGAIFAAIKLATG